MPVSYPARRCCAVRHPQGWHPDRVLSRRAVLLGTTGVGVAAVGAAGVGIQQGVLPGRPFFQELLGLNGEDGAVPDVDPGAVERGSFVSEHRLGARTGWALCRAPGTSGPIPLVVALHGLGGDHATLVGPAFGLPEFLAQAVADGVPPYAIATVDGGTSYWHERPSGEDAGAMVVDELLPLLAEHDVTIDRIGLMGWSMGGYGALRLGALLGPERVAAVCAASPALWSDGGSASASGFEDADEYDEFRVTGHQDDLTGIPVRIDCGTGDPFYPAVEEYVDGFPDDADLTSSFEPGRHEDGYWRRMLPAELEFLGRRVSSSG
jgi:S-formylglutathione hydrolase FrmB